MYQVSRLHAARCCASPPDNAFSVKSVSVHILANNALQAHHASAHGGASTNGLSDIFFFFFLNDSIELLEIMFDGRALLSLAVVGKKLFPNVLLLTIHLCFTLPLSLPGTTITITLLPTYSSSKYMFVPL